MSAGRWPSGNCQPPEPCPFYEQAMDEVGGVFDTLANVPDSIFHALDQVDREWLSKAQDAWCAIRAKELEAEYEEARAERDEP